MSKKSSSFKRKLKSAKVGFKYFRIWGWPIKEYNRSYIESVYGNRPDHALFDFNGQLIQLYIEHGEVASRGSLFLNGSLTNGCYFRTESQALRELRMYSSGCKTDGLLELIAYSAEIDAMDIFGDNV